MRLNRRFFLFVTLAVASGLLLAARRPMHPVGRAAQRTLDRVTYPVEVVVAGVRDTGLGAWRWGEGLFAVRQENAALRARLVDLERALREREEDRLENERLRRLLALPAPIERLELPAHVIGSDPTNWFRTIRIDRGLKDGVRVESPVIADGGVVGHVIEVTPQRATVLLLLDANCRVAALLQDTREQGLIEGRHATDLRLTYVDRRTPLGTGETVVTSGMGGIYPKGLVIGRVARVERPESEIFLIASIEPAVDFTRLEDVIVLLSPPPEAPLTPGDLATS